MSSKKLRRPLSHRWMEDYDYRRVLSGEDLTWLRTFTYEYYYNTRDSDPSKHIHKDFVRDGEAVNAMHEDGFGIYKAFNDAERDLYAKLQNPTQKSFYGIMVSADSWAEQRSESGEQHFQAEDLYPPTESPEDSIIDSLDSDEEVDDELAGTKPEDLTVVVTRADGSTIACVGTTYLNRKGILVRNVRAKDGSRLWPDDRDAATKALHKLRGTKPKVEVETDPWIDQQG